MHLFLYFNSFNWDMFIHISIECSMFSLLALSLMERWKRIEATVSYAFSRILFYCHSQLFIWRRREKITQFEDRNVGMLGGRVFVLDTKEIFCGIWTLEMPWGPVLQQLEGTVCTLNGTLKSEGITWRYVSMWNNKDFLGKTNKQKTKITAMTKSLTFKYPLWKRCERCWWWSISLGFLDFESFLPAEPDQGW